MTVRTVRSAHGVKKRVVPNFKAEGRGNPGTGAAKSVPPVIGRACIDKRSLWVSHGGREPWKLNNGAIDGLRPF